MLFDPPPPTRPALCPQCHTPGAAYRVTAGGGQITIAYRCPACGHAWSVARDDRPRPSGSTIAAALAVTT